MLEHFDHEQGSEAWLKCRLGIPTASMFHAVMSKGQGSNPSKTRQTYMYKLAGEVITGEISEGFETASTKRGHVMEEKARFLYEIQRGVDVIESGFYRDGKKGCSLDGQVGDDGTIEVKSKAPHILIPLLLGCEVPEEHKAQIQGGMLITDRKWCDFIAYFTGMPIMIKRVYRDDEYCRELNKQLTIFNYDLDALVNKLEVMK